MQKIFCYFAGKKLDFLQKCRFSLLHLSVSVHKDVTERLSQIDYDAFLEVKHILDFNLSERHIRGGISTKKRFKGI